MRVFLLQFRRRHEGLAFRFRGEARRLGEQREVLGPRLAKRGREAGLVDVEDDLVLGDDVADPDRDLGDDAALEVLDDLDLARRDDLALPDRDFLEVGEGGPDEKDQEQDERAADDQEGGARRVLQERPEASRHEIGLGLGLRVGRCLGEEDAIDEVLEALAQRRRISSGRH